MNLAEKVVGALRLCRSPDSKFVEPETGRGLGPGRAGVARELGRHGRGPRPGHLRHRRRDLLRASRDGAARRPVGASARRDRQRHHRSPGDTIFFDTVQRAGDEGPPLPRRPVPGAPGPGYDGGRHLPRGQTATTSTFPATTPSARRGPRTGLRTTGSGCSCCAHSKTHTPHSTTTSSRESSVPGPARPRRSERAAGTARTPPPRSGSHARSALAPTRRAVAVRADPLVHLLSGRLDRVAAQRVVRARGQAGLLGAPAVDRRAGAGRSAVAGRVR